MRLNTISRQMNEMIEKINSIKKIQSLPLTEQINSYICRIRDIQKQNFIVSFKTLNKYQVIYQFFSKKNRKIQRIKVS